MPLTIDKINEVLTLLEIEYAVQKDIPNTVLCLKDALKEIERVWNEYPDCGLKHARRYVIDALRHLDPNGEYTYIQK